jgi:hypothetical protein
VVPSCIHHTRQDVDEDPLVAGPNRMRSPPT